MPARKVVAPIQDEGVLSEDDLAGAEARTVDAKIARGGAAIKNGIKRKAKQEARQVLKDTTNVQPADNQAVQSDVAHKHAAKRPKTDRTISRAKPAKSAGRENVVPDTQEAQQEVEAIEDTVEMPEPATAVPYVRATSTRPALATVNRRNDTRPASVQPSNMPGRGASASDTERDIRSDAEARRQLTVKTRECENLRLRNQTLEDLARTKAETNFEKLKAEADLKTKRADDLVAALRKEIAVLRKSCSSTTTETTSLQKQVQSAHARCERLTSENEQFTVDAVQLKSSIHKLENEKQALEVKLMAARQQICGAITDSKGGSTRPAAGVYSEVQRELKMKENLYADLTGLIIRGVKRRDGEDEYDCIQTGRNGTLQFHLSVMNELSANNPKTPSAYEEAEFSYEPLLDETRDRDLLEILPDYLSEDICFLRNHAVKFYTKLVESMTKKVVLEDDEE